MNTSRNPQRDGMLVRSFPGSCKQHSVENEPGQFMEITRQIAHSILHLKQDMSISGRNTHGGEFRVPFQSQIDKTNSDNWSSQPHMETNRHVDRATLDHTQEKNTPIQSELHSYRLDKSDSFRHGYGQTQPNVKVNKSSVYPSIVHKRAKCEPKSYQLNRPSELNNMDQTKSNPMDYAHHVSCRNSAQHRQHWIINPSPRSVQIPNKNTNNSIVSQTSAQPIMVDFTKLNATIHQMIMGNSEFNVDSLQAPMILNDSFVPKQNVIATSEGPIARAFVPTVFPISSVPLNQLLCTNNNSLVTNILPPNSVKRLDMSQLHADAPPPKFEVHQTPNLLEKPSFSLCDIKEEIVDIEDIDVETVVDVNPLTGVEKNQDMVKCKTEAIDNLIESINRVAKGEGGLSSKTHSNSSTLLKYNQCEGNSKETVSDRQKKKVTGRQGPVKILKPAEMVMEKNTRKLAKQLPKPNQNMKVTVVKSLNPSAHLPELTNKPDTKSMYLADQTDVVNPSKDALLTNKDTITQIETYKLSTVNGHHLLSLTENEKRYLRYKRYIEPGATTKKTRERKTSEQLPVEQKYVQNVTRGMPVRNVRQSTSQPGGKNDVTPINHESLPVKTSFPPSQLKVPIVRLKKLDLQNNSIKVLPYVSQTATTGSLELSSTSKKTEDSQNLQFDKAANLRMTKYRENVNSSAVDKVSTYSPEGPSLQSTSKRPDYIRIGNGTYCLIHNENSKLVVKTSKEVTPSSAIASISSKIARRPQSTSNKPTPERSMTKQRQQTHQCTDNQTQNKDKLIALDGGLDTDEIKHELVNPEVLTSQNLHILDQVKEIPVETESKPIKLIKVDSSEKLLIPIKVINPQDIAKHRCNGRGKNTQTKTSGKRQTTPEKEDATTKRCPGKKSSSNRFTFSFQFPKTKTKRLTSLPAPQRRVSVTADNTKGVYNPIPYLTRKSIFFKGFSNIIKSLLSMSRDPLVEFASCLDLIPNDDVLYRRRVDLKECTEFYDCVSDEPRRSVDLPETSSRNDDKPDATNYVTAVQIFKDSKGVCEYTISHMKLVESDNKQFKRRFQHSNYPCKLHFDSRGVISKIEAHDISKGLYVALDCAETRPTARERIVYKTLSVYPPTVSAIPSDTLALVLGDMYSEGVNDKLYKVKAGNELDAVIADVLGNLGIPQINYDESRYGSITKQELSPRYHSPMFYSNDYFAGFEQKMLRNIGYAYNENEYENTNNNKNNAIIEKKAFRVWRKQKGTSPRFSERAMALKLKQNELFESCRKLKVSTQLRRKRQKLQVYSVPLDIH